MLHSTVLKSVAEELYRLEWKSTYLCNKKYLKDIDNIDPSVNAINVTLILFIQEVFLVVCKFFFSYCAWKLQLQR